MAALRIFISSMEAMPENARGLSGESILSQVRSLLSDQQWNVFFKRIIAKGKERQTLEEIGRCLKITRERVRQIESKAFSNIKHSLVGKLLSTYSAEIFKHLKKEGGIAPSRRVFEMLPGLDAQGVDIVIAFNEFFKKTNIRKLLAGETEYITILPDEHIEEAYADLNGQIEDVLGMQKEAARETLQLDLWYSQNLEDFCIDKLFSEDAVLGEDGILCGLIGKSLLNAEYIFLSAGTPIHMDEAYARYVAIHGTDATPISLRGFIDRSENIVIWDRGIYIHTKLIDVKLEPLGDIYSKIEAGLSNAERKTTVTSIYDNNQELMNYMRIPTTYALYSILRIHDNNKFLYRKYPDIEHPRNMRQARRGRDEELNNFFLSQKRPIFKDELVDHFVGKRGMREYHIFLAMQRCPEIYTLGENRYIHAKYLKLKREHVEEIITKVKAILKREPYAIIGKLLERIPLPKIEPYVWSRYLLANILRKNSTLKIISHAAVTAPENAELNCVEDLIRLEVEKVPVKLSRQSLTSFLKAEKITSSAVAVDKFEKKYGFLLEK